MKKKNIILRIKNRLKQYRTQIFCFYDTILMNKKIKSKHNKNRIYIFGSPNQVNLGDQAQTYCIERWLKSNYPNHELFIFTYFTITNTILKSIRNTINRNDLIIIHSGYHITDLYNLIDKYCKIIELFPDFPIKIFPQTINFEKDKEKEKYVSNVFNKHGNITLMCRDEISYKKAEIIFNNCKLLLYPDIVTSLIGKIKYNFPRKGILFCMRNDKEAYYSSEAIDKLRAKLSPIPTKLKDTDSKLFYRKIQKNREQVLNNKFKEFANYKVVITDRYHGTIFALIANTPVIVLSSKDHKLSSGVKWFPKDFGHFVTFANSLEEAYSLAKQLYQENLHKNQLPDYFQSNYYSILKEKL